MKKQKFMKVLGVGAVATLGLFTIAGCSSSDDEKADVMEGLENANTYMEETIDLLKEQNRKLNEQNNQLEEYINEVQKENAKITAKEAYNKLMLAKAKLETNNNGIRDNLRVICFATDGEIVQNQIVDLYKTENNGYVSNVIIDDDRGYCSDFCYENDGKVYEYIKDVDTEGNIDYTKVVRSDFLSAESGSGLTYAMAPLFLDKLSAGNIYSVEILENGNYKISAIIESEVKEEDEKFYFNKQVYLLDYEITSDYKFVSMNLTQYIKCEEEIEGGETEKLIQTMSGVITIEYNKITEEYINDLLEEAINKELKAE